MNVCVTHQQQGAQHALRQLCTQAKSINQNMTFSDSENEMQTLHSIFFFFLWSDHNHRADYFVTLRRVSSAKRRKSKKVLDYCSPEALDTNVSIVLASMTSWGQIIPVSDGSWQEWVPLVLGSALWLPELLLVSSSLTWWWWWLELVLNSISSNDVVVDSVQHRQPIYQIIVIF